MFSLLPDHNNPLDTLNRTEFCTIMEIYFKYMVTSKDFLNYLAQLLEDPQRSMTHVFDQQRYAMASKECMQLCLCSHHKFSKRAVESAHQDNMLRSSKPWLWKRRLGVHSRIRECRHYLKVRRSKLIEVQRRAYGSRFFPDRRLFSGSFPEHKYYRSSLYGWGLDLLSSILEKSAISLELAESFAWPYIHDNGTTISTENEIGQGGDNEVSFMG